MSTHMLVEVSCRSLGWLFALMQLQRPELAVGVFLILSVGGGGE